MTTAFLTNWIYVAVFIAAGAAMVVGILLMSRLVYPIHPSPEKYSTYECGIEPVGDSWHPFAVRYYIFALLFLVFDVEAIFLFPWALTFRRLGTSGFVEVLIFIAVLLVGLVYAWRKGALEWV
jgi:NADH:ubiquinone oxidoreductase subunit 3 (subunit A)